MEVIVDFTQMSVMIGRQLDLDIFKITSRKASAFKKFQHKNQQGTTRTATKTTIEFDLVGGNTGPVDDVSIHRTQYISTSKATVNCSDKNTSLVVKLFSVSTLVVRLMFASTTMELFAKTDSSTIAPAEANKQQNMVMPLGEMCSQFHLYSTCLLIRIENKTKIH